MMCWRVPVQFYRQDVTGRVRRIERHGPVIAACSSEEAEAKAIVIFQGCPDYAGIGAASYEHTGHQGLRVVSPTELRPAQAPEIPLEASLARMAAHIRARARRRQDDPVKEEK